MTEDYQFMAGWIYLMGLILVAGALLAYSSSRDPLHPAIVVGGLFFLGYVVNTWNIHQSGQVARFFGDPEALNYVLQLYCACILALVLGFLVHMRVSAGAGPASAESIEVLLTDSTRRWLLNAAVILAIVAIGAYLYQLAGAGGFVKAYSRAKGGGRAASGYLGEAMMLGLVAALLLGLAVRGKPWRWQYAWIALAGLIPQLMQGTFGGRRGPLFISLTAAALAWAIYRKRTVSLVKVMMVGCAILLAVIFVWSQRRHLYLGSEGGIDGEMFRDRLQTKVLSQGDNFVYGGGLVLTARQSGRHYWGKRLLVTLLVRPIPRQLWPTKYEDTGATWVNPKWAGLGGFTPAEWQQAVGWLPYAGSASGCFSDLYLEFGWLGAVVVSFALGNFFSLLWRRMRRDVGLMALLYAEAVMLSVYLSTQSFFAWFYRFLIMGIPTLIIWRFLRRKAALHPGVPGCGNVSYDPGTSGRSLQ